MFRTVASSLDFTPALVVTSESVIVTDAVRPEAIVYVMTQLTG